MKPWIDTDRGDVSTLGESWSFILDHGLPPTLTKKTIVRTICQSSVAKRGTMMTEAHLRTRRIRAPGDVRPVCLHLPCSLSPTHLKPDTAFKQQRLKAWQPILTPKTVLPTLFIIGIIFAPIGGLLIWGSSLVSEMTFDYSQCENLTPSTSNSTLSFTNMLPSEFSYRLRSADKNAQPSTPRYAFLDNTSNSSVTDVTAKRQCIVDFDIPAELSNTVLFYYKLSNFYQNHRRYVKSLDTDQLKGKHVSVSDLQNSDCKPLDTINGKAIYPCGLIANSLFNGPSVFLLIIMHS